MDRYHPKTCKQCGKPLAGRLDKQFCDAYCRNTYNNQNKSKGERTIASVNSILRRNRKLLKELSPMGKATVRKEILDAMGYDYRYFTNIYKSKSQAYFVCYDFAMGPIVDNKGIKKVLIVQKQDYFDGYTPKLWV